MKKGIKKETGQEFAIKIIDKEHLEEENLICLKRELKILGIVDHPNIVRVYEYYETPECVFVVMENMEGGEVNIVFKFSCSTELLRKYITLKEKLQIF